MATTFSNKTEILADLWLNFSEDERFEQFAEINNVGLPLAFLVKYDFCTLTESGTISINDTFAELIDMADVEDIGFANLNEIFAPAK
jgi:hypothetical protein